jgi:DNA-binding transcriptional LysR family regulator
MEIRHLIYFKTVAEKLNFTRAAEALHISQPPLTRQIRDLETELGKKLFLRSTARVELTEAGRYFLGEADAILERLEGARAVVSQMDNRSQAPFRIGYMSSIPLETLTGIVGSLKARFPFLKTALFEIPTVRQLRALELDKLDVGILRAPVHSSRVAWQPVLKDRFSLVQPGGRETDIGELQTRDFISFNRNVSRYYHAQLMACCSYLGFEPRIVCECNHIRAILSLVQQGLGITILPSIVRLAHSQGRLTFTALDGLPFHTEIALAYPSGKAHPATAIFLSETRRHLTSAYGGDPAANIAV